MVKIKLDSPNYTAIFLSPCNDAQKEKRSSMSGDSGSDCETRHKKQRRVDLGSQVTRDVDNGASEHIRQIDEAHKKRMAELTQKQNVEILGYFRTKNRRKESLDKAYQLEKDVICEQCGESSLKAGKLKQLDEDFKMKLEGLRREMDNRWEDLKAVHLVARTNEEEMRLKRIELLKSAINSLEDGEIFEGWFDEMENVQGTSLHADSEVTKVDAPSEDGEIFEGWFDEMENIQGTSLHADSEVTKVDVPSTCNDSGNPNAPLLESESAINTVKDGGKFEGTLLHEDSDDTKTGAPSRLIDVGYPNMSLLESESAIHTLEDGELSPDDSPMEDLIAKPVEPNKQMGNSIVPVVLGEPVISSSSTDTEMAFENDENQISQGSLPCSNEFVVIGSDDKQIYVKSVQVPVDETAFPSSSSIEQLDMLSIPATPDNLNTSELLGNQGHINSSEELAVPSDTFRDSACDETAIICLDSDDEPTHEASAAAPVNELLDASNLSEEAPGISSEQQNLCSVGISGNELEACFSTEENLHQEAQRMLGGVSSEVLPGCSQGSMNLDTAVAELSRQIQGTAATTMHRLRLISMAQQQSRQFPMEQLPLTQLPSSEIRVTDESVPSSSYHYVTENHLMMHPLTRMAEINAQPQFSDTTNHYHVNHSTNSHVTRPNGYQRPGFDPLQIELAKINKKAYAAKKNYEDTVVQLELSREKEMAEIRRKYGLVLQEAENDARQKRKELELCYEKTKAHMLLAKAWAMEVDVNSIIFQPSTHAQFTGMATNSCAGLVNQFSGGLSTNQIARPQNPHPCQNLLDSGAGWGSYIPDPRIYPSCATPYIPIQSNPIPLNFSSSDSSVGYF